MASTPRLKLDDSYTLGITCAICGADALSVNHVPNMPDYVTCAQCNSAFLVEEGGDRVFYGQLAAGYSETERFALKQWAWLEAVETRAREERPEPAGSTPDRPPIEMPSAPDDIAGVEDEMPVVESSSAEDWISSEIPSEDLQEAIATDPAELEQAGDHFEPLEAEAIQADFPATADEDPFAFQPYDLEQQEPSSDPAGESPEAESLADFFEALTDEVEDVAPGLDPDAVLADEAPSDEGTLDADLDRLLKTEGEDGGPDLPPPPWAAESEPEIASPVQEPVAEDAPSWEGLRDLEPIAERDAIPVVDAKDETYEALPSFKNIEQPAAPSEMDEVVELPDWGAGVEDTPADDIPSWTDFAEEESIPEDAAAPEPPSWALAADEEPEVPIAKPAEADDLSWNADRLEEPSSSWQEVPETSTDASAEDDDDFLSGLRRSAAVPLESQPIADQPISESDFTDSEVSWDMGADDLSARMESVSQPVEQPESVAAGWEMTAASSIAEPEPEPEPILPDPELLTEDEVYAPPASDPPMGQRSRVVIRGERVVFPGGDCAHCGRTPVKGKLAIAGTLPRGQTVGQRRPTRFEVPLCTDCRSRAASKSEEAKAAQLQAHLISAIVGMVLVVGALALDLINPRDLGIADLFLGLILLIVGYGGPAFFLLNRVGDYLPPVDARYIRTTLLVPSETQGLETAFEWRNSEYATRFHDANQANTLGNVTSVKDRIG